MNKQDLKDTITFVAMGLIALTTVFTTLLLIVTK